MSNECRKTQYSKLKGVAYTHFLRAERADVVPIEEWANEFTYMARLSLTEVEP